jgi:hypothetical protein
MQVMHIARPRNGPFAKESKLAKTPVTKLFSTVVDMTPSGQLPSLLLSHHQLASLSRDVTEDSSPFLGISRSTTSDDSVSTIDQYITDRNARPDNRIGLYPLSNAIFEPINRYSSFNLASLTSDSGDAIGYNRPLGSINARERTRRKSQTTFSREHGDAVHLESMTKFAQEKQQGEMRDALMKDNRERKKIWRKALALSFVQINSTVKLSQQINEERSSKKREIAARIIQQCFVKYKHKMFSGMFSRFIENNPRFINIFAFTVSLSYSCFATQLPIQAAHHMYLRVTNF